MIRGHTMEVRDDSRSPSGYMQTKEQVEEYSCENLCNDLPYTLWNTCPLCICGLMPVFIVVFSAIFRLDYATHMTDFGAQVMGEVGLSYTIYYTAGCWPQTNDSLIAAGGLHSNPPCNTERFEIAAGEFDALTGSLLKVQNVTKLHARRVEAVKVTPDWRYIMFVGALANDIGNLYVVGAEQRDAVEAIPLLTEKQLDSLDDRCQAHSQNVLKAAGLASIAGEAVARQPLARLAGFKHLQVIIPGIRPIQRGEDLDASMMPQPTASTSVPYRAAFAFQCAEAAALSKAYGPPGSVPLRFSQLAVVDFQLVGLNTTNPLNPTRWGAYAESALHIVDAEPAGDSQVATYQSQECPRFVPSHLGHQLLFITEEPVSAVAREPLQERWLPNRLLALTSVPRSNFEMQSSPLAVASSRAGDLPLQAMHQRLLEKDVAVDHAPKPGERSQDLGWPPAEAWGFPDKPPPHLPFHPLPSQATDASTATSTKPAIPSTSTTLIAATSSATFTSTSTSTATSTTESTTSSTSSSTSSSTVTLTTTLAFYAPAWSPTSGWFGPDIVMTAEPVIMLRVGEGFLPRAPVRGCPEFVPGVYVSTDKKKESVFIKGQTVKGNPTVTAASKFRDTFVVMSDPASESVVGVDAQVLTVTLPQGLATGDVEHVQLLYNVDNAPPPEDILEARREARREETRAAQLVGIGREGLAGLGSVTPQVFPLPAPRLRLGGCQPIRAAGTQGHLRLAWISETMMGTRSSDSDGGYSTWLACITANQQIAIVSSGVPDQWVNMSVPYPMWTGKSIQDIWCPPDREEACFEVWSNPNPYD